MNVNFEAMNIKEQIEEILLNDFGSFDDYTVEKLLNLHSVVGRSEQLHSCKYVKRIGESCTLNNNCKHPNCE